MCRLPCASLTVPPHDAPIPGGHWVSIPPEHAGEGGLRCWWSPPVTTPRAGLLVLPEVFGLNGWVRGVADRLAGEGYGALALPLFSRTAPDLDLDYSPDSLRLGRSHKDRTKASELLLDAAQALRWLQASLAAAGAPGAPIGCLGFCFGGHAALLISTLDGIEATCDFYGAGVVSGRPGGGPPTLDGVAEVRGRLLCVCGSDDPLIPPQDVEALGKALSTANQGRLARGQQPHRLLILKGGHGFLCDQRDDHEPESAALAWGELLAFLSESLGSVQGFGGVSGGG